MNRFYTNITHEFRSQLTLVKSIGEILRQKVESGVRSKGEFLTRNADRSLQLIDHILTLRKLEGLNLTPRLEPREVISYL